MKEWRPEGWKNPHEATDPNRCPVMDTSYSNPVRDASIFEAGADAMLGAFSGEWVYVTEDKSTVIIKTVAEIVSREE